MRAALRLNRLLLTTAILGLQPIAAHAQIFTGSDASRIFRMPDNPPPTPVAVPTPVAEGLPADQPTLHRLDGDGAAFRFDGEAVQHGWTMTLSPGEIVRANRFRLNLRSAATVMPEGSTVRVAVNGIEIGKAAIRAAAQLQSLEFATAGAGLKPGPNTVRIAVDQRHRVDCSVPATYELWTDLDQTGSGLVVEGAPGQHRTIVPVEAIAAALPREDGATPLRIIVKDRLTPPQVENLFRVSQAAALLGGFRQTVIELSSAMKDAPGVSLVVGLSSAVQDELKALDIDPPAGPGAYLVDRGTAQAMALIVIGDDEGQLEGAIRQLTEAAARRPEPTPGMFRASGLAERVPFAALGLETQRFSGHSFRGRLNVAMPADFMPADYSRAEIHLKGRFAADRRAASRLAVIVNGQEVASTVLSGRGDMGLASQRLLFPVGKLRPGANVIEILGEFPNHDGVACDAPDETARPVFELDQGSELVLPQIARAGHLPDMAVMASTGRASGIRPEATNVLLPAPTRQSVAAALTLAARLSAASGKVTDYRFATSIAAAGPGDMLEITPAPALDPDRLRQMTIDPEALQSAWDKAAASEAPAPDSFCRTGRAQPAALAAGGDDVSVTAQSKGLMAQRVLGEGTQRRLWTVMTAARQDDLTGLATCLTQPSRWSTLRGDLAVLQESGSLATRAAAGRINLGPDHLSVSNLRLVAAGWLSLNPAVLILMVLLATVATAFSTDRLVRDSGRRQP